jgi:hypothetical protein
LRGLLEDEKVTLVSPLIGEASLFVVDWVVGCWAMAMKPMPSNAERNKTFFILLYVLIDGYYYYSVIRRVHQTMVFTFTQLAND